MRALRNCDFCDADAAGTFEVLPPELEPTDAEQRRVVLCPDCQTRLADLLEPLLERARGARSDADRSTAEPPSKSDDGRKPTDESESGTVVVREPTRTRDRADDPNATVSDAADGVSFGHDETADAADRASDDSSADSPAAESAAAEAATAAPTTDDSAGESEESEGSTRPPKAYGKVVRLLRNREFPMKRRAVESLAAGAYDLEDHEAEAVVDHALEEGEFVEKRGKLRRP